MFDKAVEYAAMQQLLLNHYFRITPLLIVISMRSNNFCNIWFQGGGDNILAQRSDINELKDLMLYLREELASLKHHLNIGIRPGTNPRIHTGSVWT